MFIERAVILTKGDVLQIPCPALSPANSDGGDDIGGSGAGAHASCTAKRAIG